MGLWAGRYRPISGPDQMSVILLQRLIIKRFIAHLSPGGLFFALANEKRVAGL